MLQGFQKDNIVITDTSCFILLDKINAISILQQIFTKVITTPEIAKEFGKPLPNWIQIREVVNKELFISYAEKIDLGEASAIALAFEIPSPLLISDDLKGRRLAEHLQLRHTGTLGIFILAKQQGIISAFKPYFEDIKKTNFRVSHQLLQSILQELGE